jgi:hypothetical protein
MVPVCRNRGCLHRGGGKCYQTYQGWNDDTHFSLCLGGTTRQCVGGLLTKGETARWLRAPTHPSADLTRRQKRPLTSSGRSDPNANSPTIPPVDAVPTPPASLAHQFDRRCGGEFNWGCLCRGERCGLCRDGRKGHQAGECRNDRVHFSLPIGDRLPECARQRLIQPERAQV